MADGVIAVSEGVKDELILVNNSLDVRVLPNPVLTPAFDAQAREPIEHPWFRSGDIPVVLGVGRLLRSKGFATLIEAFRAVTLNMSCRLVILGEGAERPVLEQLVRDLSLEDRVSLPGFVVNPLPFMRSARVFVLSSEYEGMPNSLLQAVACGTAVVSTDCKSGPREILRDGRLGRLVPVNDSRAMAGAILEAIDVGAHPSAAAYIREKFSLTHTVSSYLDLAGLEQRSEVVRGAA